MVTDRRTDHATVTYVAVGGIAFSDIPPKSSGALNNWRAVHVYRTESSRKLVNKKAEKKADELENPIKSQVVLVGSTEATRKLMCFV